MSLAAADSPETSSGGQAVAPPAGRGRRVRFAVLLLLAALAGTLLWASAAGLSVFVVESPSMGRAAPIGTLVVSERADARSVRVGDIVTYRPVGSSTTTTHRVVRIVPGGLETRGDINGAADAMTVRPSMLVGRAVVVLPGVGRIIRLVPWTGIGVVSVFLLTWPLRNAEVRSGLRIIGACGVVTVILALQHPLIGWSMLTQRPVGHAMIATVVSTGLLPVRIDATNGGSAILVPGAKTDLLLPADAAGRVRFDASLGLEPWGWGLLVCCCLLPLIGVLIFGLPRRYDELIRSS